MTTRAFAITYDYRCPFARVLHELTLDGLEAGAGWEVTLVPLSLNLQLVNSAEELFADSRHRRALLALEVSAAVSLAWPDRHPTAHRALFNVFHVNGRSLYRPEVLTAALRSVGLDSDEVVALAGSMAVRDHLLATFQHLQDRGVDGVPTVITGDTAALVRLRPQACDPVSRVETVLDVVEGLDF